MRIYSILVSAILVLTMSCNQNTSKDITTNDVMNTKTADGSTNASLPEIKFKAISHFFSLCNTSKIVRLFIKFNIW